MVWGWTPPPHPQDNRRKLIKIVGSVVRLWLLLVLWLLWKLCFVCCCCDGCCFFFVPVVVVDFVHVMFVVFNVTLWLSENICFTSMSEDIYVVILLLTFLVCCWCCSSYRCCSFICCYVVGCMHSDCCHLVVGLGRTLKKQIKKN